MNILNDYELYNIKGGGINWGFLLAAGGIISFLAGVLDGIFNPIKCNRG